VPAASGADNPAVAAYFAFADEVQAHMEPHWRAGERCYGGLWGTTALNSNMLLVHADAARAGHRGLCRNDERALALAARLCESPPWREARVSRPAAPELPALPKAFAALDQTHEYGWGVGLNSVEGQHVVIDTAVVRGLAHGYHARHELHMPDELATLLRDRVRRCAYSTFYAFPALRLNQINWPVEIYSHAAAVTGEAHLLRHDTRLQLGRFADRLTHGAHGELPYTGPGYRFHRMPQFSAATAVNLDSAEYACIVAGVLTFYERARRAGMKPLSQGQVHRLQAWVERVLCGYWTHGGYPNWDTGEGFDRWHQSKKFPLCQEALLAIAVARRFHPYDSYAGWARYFLDRGLEFYLRLLREAKGLPPPVLFSITKTGSAPRDELLTASRMQSIALRAALEGVAEVQPRVPPPLYAYDPDIGRLAITTPAYNTAVVPVNFNAFPYGGMEIARLFDGDMRVVSSVGGRYDAAFGISVRDHGARRETRSQTPRRHGDLAHPPLRLLRAPRGTGRGLAAYPRHAYAGTFKEIVAIGSTSGHSAKIITRHTFRPAHLETLWTVLPRRRTAARHTVRALFPSWGRAATVTAVMADGTRVPLGGSAVPLAGIAWFHIEGAETGYVVVPLGARGRARLLHPARQSSAPRPGPTLALEVCRRSLVGTAAARSGVARGGR
jgi:hypothetical protein